MALNASSLAADIESGVRSSQGLGSTPYPQLTSYCQALATAIVDHIKNNAEIDNGQVNSNNVTRSPSDTATYTIDSTTVTGGIK